MVAPASRSARYLKWVLWPVLAVSGAALLLNPVSLIYEAYYIGVPLSQIAPACRTRDFHDGAHRGYAIGMSQADAAKVLARTGTAAWIEGDRQEFRLAAGGSDLLRRSTPDVSWFVLLGNTCVVQSRSLHLRFRGGRLVKITDGVDINWL